MCSALDVDLFAGAGGLALGLDSAGFGPFDLFELDPSACATLQSNVGRTFSGRVWRCDVRQTDWKEYSQPVRLLAAGTPCQPFSLGGAHRADQDDRNLFPEVLRAIRQLRPAGVLLENVRGLLRQSFKEYYQYILAQLECPSLGPRTGEDWRTHAKRICRHRTAKSYQPEYWIDWQLLEAADFGVPQLRKRVFLVATRRDYGSYSFPLPTHSREALIAAQGTADYWRMRDLPIPDGLEVPPRVGKEASADTFPWVTVRDALVGLPEAAADSQSAWNNHWLIAGARAYPGHSGSSLDWPAKTIKAGVNGVPGGENTLVRDDGSIRYLTLREAARLQTFPDEHVFRGSRSKITKQIGNAVPCLLADQVAEGLYEVLSRGKEALRSPTLTTPRRSSSRQDATCRVRVPSSGVNASARYPC